LTDAADAARRALELAESRSRRREMERLGGLLRDSGADRSAVDALDRASGSWRPSKPCGTKRSAAIAGRGRRTEPGAATDTGPSAELEVETVPPPPPDLAVLRAVADALLESGDIRGGTERLLALAALHRAAGRLDAAMDACFALLVVTPADHRLQREIAAIQLERGWTGAAAEKVRLLARLADLDGDAEAQLALADFVAERELDPPPGSVSPA
jgi:hypothetical protein